MDNAAMPWTAIALILLAALCHAVWNIGAKKAGGGSHFVMMGAVFVLLLWAPVAAWFAPQVLGWNQWQWGAVGASALLHLAYYRVLLRGYREADLTVVYPVARGSGPLLSSAAAVVLLGEQLGPYGAAGVVAMALGVFLIAGGPGLLRKAEDPAARARLKAGLGWGLLTGLLSASYTVLDGHVVRAMAVAPVLLDYIGNALRIPMMAPVVWRERATARQAWRSQWRYAVMGAVLGPGAYVMVLYAMQLAPLSRVAPAREVSMLFAAVLGGQLLGERDRLPRLLGAGCLALGVAALAWG
jgi:drug/metabolite transporter (DMT)-like permease